MKLTVIAVLALAPVLTHASSTVTQLFDESTGEASFLVTNPNHYGSNLPLAFSSSADGVCKYFGYEKAVKNSMKPTYRNEDTLRLDANGEVDLGNSEPSLLQVVCLNKAKVNLTSEISVIIKNPTHPVSLIPYAFSSSEEGVCKNLHYEDGVTWSRRTLSNTTGEYLEVDETGAVVSLKQDYIMNQVVCIKHNWQPVAH